MGYKTNYKIFNTSDKTTVFSNRSTACFAEWSSVPSDDKAKGFKKEWSMEVYSTLSDMNLKDYSLVKYWMEILNDLGLKATYEKVDLKKYVGELPIGLDKTDKAWMWTFHFADYTSKAQLRFALHLMRYLYEVDMWKAIEETKKLSKEYPNIHPFELFQYAQMWTCGYLGGGHILWSSRSFKRFVTKSDLETYYKKWAIEKENYNEVHGMLAKYSLYTYKYVSYTLPKDEKSERNRILQDKLMKGPLLTIEQYKEEIKKFENDETK